MTRLLIAILTAGGLCHAQPLEARLTQVAAGPVRTVDIQSPKDHTGRLFLVQQDGRIFVLRDGIVAAVPFLDISSRTRGQGERGLLGMVFPPGFAGKQYFYVNYTDLDGDTTLSRFRVSAADPDRADPGSEQELLVIEQPFANHNAGQLQFGPDGFLYMGTGDGGSAGDPMNNAQTRDVLLGKMLRLDVETETGRIRIPEDNPFAGDPRYRPEIWALGLRNPWRFSFDRATDDLWIADVGQNRAEEVNFQPASSGGGENYGWSRMEGLQCFVPGCSMEGLTLPILEYGRNVGLSVTGGYVYRGARSPGLRGTFLYGDFGSGRLWGVRRSVEQWDNSLLLATGMPIATFGEDEAGEVYLADYGSGAIYRIEASGAPALDPDSVTNAASFRSGLVAGSASTVFLPGVWDNAGAAAAETIPLPRQIEGVEVVVDGQPAPLFSLANSRGVEQVNFQAPFSIAGKTSVDLTVRRAGAFTVSAQVPVLPVQPGVFTSDGTNAIVVHHTDNTLATRDSPLRPGEFAYFYAAGLGPVTSPAETGEGGPFDPLAVTVDQPQVVIGGVPCDVLFSGLAPGLVGVYQVNMRIAGGIPSGSQSLVLMQAGLESPAVQVFVE